MKRALLFMTLLACHRHERDGEVEDRAKRENERPAYVPSRTPPEEALHAYESAANCEQRSQTITYPKENHELISQEHCFARTLADVNVKECNALGASETRCHAMARRNGDKKRYWLVKLPNGNFAVDFRATERPLSLYDYRLYQPKTPTVVRARAQLTGRRGKRPLDPHVDYAVVELREVDGDVHTTLVAYVARDSSEGRALLADVDDRSDTDVTLALSSPTNESPATALVTKYFGMEFFESDAENAYEALVRDGGT
jgi:hypothetical protein